MWRYNLVSIFVSSHVTLPCSLMTGVFVFSMFLTSTFHDTFSPFTSLTGSESTAVPSLCTCLKTLFTVLWNSAVGKHTVSSQVLFECIFLFLAPVHPTGLESCGSGSAEYPLHLLLDCCIWQTSVNIHEKHLWKWNIVKFKSFWKMPKLVCWY